MWDPTQSVLKWSFQLSFLDLMRKFVFACIPICRYLAIFLSLRFYLLHCLKKISQCHREWVCFEINKNQEINSIENEVETNVNLYVWPVCFNSLILEWEIRSLCLLFLCPDLPVTLTTLCLYLSFHRISYTQVSITHTGLWFVTWHLHMCSGIETVYYSCLKGIVHQKSLEQKIWHRLCRFHKCPLHVRMQLLST